MLGIDEVETEVVSVPAVLALADGTIFRGQSIGAKGNTTGEVVFNTALTGYQEILTDPSYARQIVTLTYPHVGNTGVTPEDLEALRRSMPPASSSATCRCSRATGAANESLGEFLERGKIVAIAGIDTRKLTRILREKGAQSGCIMTGENVDAAGGGEGRGQVPGLKSMDLAKVVATKRSFQWNEGSVWQDSGRPADPLRSSACTSWPTTSASSATSCACFADSRLPHDGGAGADQRPAEVLSSHPDGVFLSNGPGDPEPCDYAIKATRETHRDRACRCSASAWVTRFWVSRAARRR